MTTLAVLLLAALTPERALACVDEAGRLHIPMFVMAHLTVGVAIAIVTLVAWALQRLFFRHAAAARTSWASTLLAAAGVTALLLGAAGAFAVPAYSRVYADFGADLPAPTALLIAVRHALWMPAVLLLLSLRAANRRFHHSLFYSAFLAGETFLLGLVLWALCLPAVKLGCA